MDNNQVLNLILNAKEMLKNVESLKDSLPEEQKTQVEKIMKEKKEEFAELEKQLKAFKNIA